ncbi:HET-domain-containing protein, partial [Pyrenochaeta sp. DS3sAY3a]
IEQCVACHSSCGSQGIAQRSFVPARLLDVQGEDPSRVKLVDTKSDIPLPYCTLSHCWGGLDVRKLTRDSERALRTGVLIKELPRTFKDAVDVCRELNVPYLWIDSLCIFQDTDDLTDWHAQSATMGDIYRSAYINIAASSATDSTVGLRFSRNTFATIPFTFVASNEPQPSDVESNGHQGSAFVVTPSHFTDEVECSILSLRAWVLQERFLSPRIIHFSSVGVFWECMTNLCSDIHPDLLPPTIHPDPFSLKKLLLHHTNANLLGPQRPWDEELYGSWSQLLSYYSECELSFETDRLIAINGIAQRLAQVTGDSFICGLWKQHLIPQLLWYRWRSRGGIKLLKGLAPTWSWAS